MPARRRRTQSANHAQYTQKNRRQAEKEKLPLACCAFSATKGVNSNQGKSGAISHSRACFARESRQARTGVRNWRIKRRKARSGKARSLRGQKKFRHRAARFCTVMCGDFEFCKERHEGVYCVLDRMSDAGKAQNIPQHKAKPIVKFIVPSPLEPLTTAVRRKKRNCLTPVALSAQRKAQTPVKVNQERYRTAGRVLPRSLRGECTCVLDPSSDDCKARSGKARSLRPQKKKIPASCCSPIVKLTVPSPLEPLTTVFGKGTCVSAPL